LSKSYWATWLHAFTGTCQWLSSLSKPFDVNVAGNIVQFADALKLLGVTLDSTLYVQSARD